MPDTHARLRPNIPVRRSAESAAPDADALFNYPSLERLFSPGEGDNDSLGAMRERLTATVRRLDSVTRRGTPADARKAAAIARAYELTLSLLAELEQHHDAARRG